MVGIVGEVVISGIGGKFPETDNMQQLQEKLFAKDDFVTKEMRWTADTVGVGKMHEIDTFDTSLFKMHSKLVRATDPTTTQTLERAFEAIIDAGMNPFAMSGRNIAVISASMVSDSENTRAGTSYETSGFTIMGHNRSMVANRISYTFNFTGPSFSIHTSWAGGAHALQRGAELIAQGYAEAAVVTTASLIFFRAAAVEYEHMHLLTPGSRCRSFDADANGTCRSEGVVSFFLQRATDAKRNYATVLKAQANCLGTRACSLIHFDGLVEKNLNDFYVRNNIDPDDIAYLEADGCGVKYFDALELNALSSVFAKRKKPLPIGSVKSNIGNTEASSSFMGIIKSIIAFETGLIPPNIHYSKPNPDVPALLNGQFEPVTEARELEGDLVSVNTLSLGGTVGHVVIRRNSKKKEVLAKGQLAPDGLYRLITTSARHEEGAKLNVEKLQSMPVDIEYASLVNDIFKTNIPGFLWKSYVVVPTSEIKYNIKKYDNIKQPLWYVFSGMGSQWIGMGRDLLQIPLFAAAVDKCDAVLRPRGVDIRHILTTDDKTIFNNILNCFVGIAAVQIGLVDILRAMGLEPDGMVGHSVGELGCAYADGCFTAEEMVLAAYARGKASLEVEVIPGMMAAIGLGYKDMRDRLPPSIDIACRNASDSCTLSGPTDDVINYVSELKQQNIFAKAVSAGNVPYHSRYIKPIAPKLLEYLTELIKEKRPRSAKWVSSSVPEANWADPAAQFSSAEYHTNNLLNPVLFEEACHHIPANAIVIEIAPHGLLQAILRRSLKEGCVNVPLTNRQGDNGVKHLLEAIGTLYLHNVSVDVNALYPAVEYPVSRGTPYIAPLVTWDHHETWFNEFENILELMCQRFSELAMELDEYADDYSFWADHCIEGQIVIPPSQVLVYLWNTILSTNNLEFEKETILFEEMVMVNQPVIQPYSQKIMLSIRKGTSNFGLFLNKKDIEGDMFMTGRVTHISGAKPNLELPSEEEEEDKDVVEVSESEVLNALSHFGYQLGPQFQAFDRLHIKNKGFTGTLKWTGNMVSFLDAVFKLILVMEMEAEQQFLYPSSFRTLIIDAARFFELEKGSEVKVHYDSRSKILRCPGLMLESLKTSPDPSLQPKLPPLEWKRKSFVPFNYAKLKLEDFLSVSLQLAAEEGLNSWKKKVTPMTLVVIKDNNGTQSLIRKNIGNVLSSLIHINAKVREVDLGQVKEQMVFKQRDRYLVAGGYQALEHLVGVVESNVFLMAYVDGAQIPVNGSSALKPVLVHHISGGGKLLLLKKRANVKQMRILEVEQEQWLTDLDHLFNGSDNGQPVVVVTRSYSPQQVLPTLAKQKYAHRLKCFFLDKSAPKFFASSPLYHSQLSLGLSVNVLHKGIWGTDRTLSVDIDSLEHSDTTWGFITSSDPNLDLSMVGFNTTKTTYEPDNILDQVELKYVDYCGTVESGERVMGLAHFNSHTNTLTPDHSLCWQVPDTWSMEEAATIPVVYSLAYYSLIVRGRLKPCESVLVQVGTSPVSQACVAVALEYGADVFVTLQSKDLLAPLLRAFPQLKADQVLFLEHFDTKVKLMTSGKGMRVVVNCLPHSQTHLSISCLGEDSRFIHLSDIDLRHKAIVGMSVFIKNSNMFGVSVSSLFNADNETKNRIHNYLRAGLKKGVVKPLKRRVFTLNNFSQALENLKERSCEEKTLVVIKAEGRSELLSASLHGFHCEPDKTYVIVGSGEWLWLNLAEWLVQQGARKLFLAPDRDSKTTSFSQRFNQLLALSYVRIVLTSISRLSSHSEAVDFLKEAEGLGPVSAIFCVALEEDSPEVAYLDSAAKQQALKLKQFVCLLGGNTSVCQSRAQLGLPARLIQSESPLAKPQAVLPYLSSILADYSSPGHTFLVRDQHTSCAQDEINLVTQDPHNFLPSSVEELLPLIDETSMQPSLHEVVTRSPCHEAVKHNILPVFLLPGTHTALLQPFLRHLLHPTYSTTLPVYPHSVESTAQFLLEEVLKVQPHGPYNLVGESWSGALALHLATLLEAHGHQVELFLLSGAPATAQQCAQMLCDEMNSLEIGLLTTLLHLESQTIKEYSKLTSWEELLQQALQLVQCGPEVLPEEVQNVKQGLAKLLTTLNNHLKALLAYKPRSLSFKGTVHLIRPKSASDNNYCGLTQYCQQKPIVHVTEDENHKEMVKSHACATIINENLLYSWNF